MNDDAVAAALHDVKEAIVSLTVGMTRMLAIQARQTDMLKEVLAAVIAEPSGPSPLQEALKHLIGLAEGHTAALERIENTLAGQKGR